MPDNEKQSNFKMKQNTVGSAMLQLLLKSKVKNQTVTKLLVSSSFPTAKFVLQETLTGTEQGKHEISTMEPLKRVTMKESNL